MIGFSGRMRKADLDRLRNKVLRRLPQAAKAELSKANLASAREQVELYVSIAPKDEGELVATAAAGPAPDVSAVAAQASVGDAQHPYPLHLEGGHRNKDGTHTPGKPAWNPARRVLRKKAKARNARAMSKALKVISG